MILADPPYTPGKPHLFQVTLANAETIELEATKVETEGGALVLRGLKGELKVAFGPGAWLEVQPA